MKPEAELEVERIGPVVRLTLNRPGRRNALSRSLLGRLEDALAEAAPDKAALEMLFTGAAISAGRAFELGLVNRVVPAEALDASIRELSDAIVAMSPTVIRIGKAAFYELREIDEEAAYHRAVDIMTDNALRPEAQEGIGAFLEKRRPAWSDR